MTLHVVLYHPAPDVLTKAPRHMEAHGARIQAFAARGDLLMVGTFGEPQTQGSMAIFRTREAAEAFVAEDPFVLNGVVERHELREWNEILGTEVPQPA